MTVTAAYGWWVAAVVLIGAEMLLPGVFLLWIGFAAGAMGLVTWLAPGLGWPAQAAVFSVLAIFLCWLYWQLLRPIFERRDDAPLLNHRAQRMIGRTVVVAEAITHGRGKVAVGDGQWLAEGPDLPAGTSVEITGVHGSTFMVRPVTAEDLAQPVCTHSTTEASP